ncbi:peptidase S26B, signal peptidase [Natronococcus amylolyticus DSM 10524]|uniref:Peptidase S26B, signal peptidase n=1 Tax=Natronococcus amylolyticus DSM 10524 TaxID=1227497 RepID=L9XGW0_9EURY|nr:S26 family signal peptidase [Natronococcus amylolyticus]ELY60950.1 peptidase S26B, signal peptidase [Natronococcus amylolyticus DSM 10524]
MRSVAARVTAGALVLAVTLLVVGQLLGQPILLGYVATGSMEPTMDAGDGFVAIPDAVTGSPSEGDVVVFDAEELHGGELTTHRIVEETPEGYVTAGDANPFTDQGGDEPPVSDDQIVAVAWQPGGEVVTIPYLGTAIMGVQGALESAYGTAASVIGVSPADSHGMGSALVGLGVALFGVGLLLDRVGVTRRETARSTSRENVYAFWGTVALVVFVIVALATAAMVAPAGTYEYEVAVTESPTDDPQILAPGETGELTREVENAGYAPVVVVHETGGGLEAEPGSQTLGPRSESATTLSVSAPQETGEYTSHVGEYRYLTVLPPSLLVWLHGIHPLAAIAAVDLVLVSAVVGTVILLFGRGDFRIRSPGDHVPLSTRLRRRLRRWR